MVKPNPLYAEEYEEDQPFLYCHDDEIVRPLTPSNALDQSMYLLADGLQNGALLAQYETLYRKHPDMFCDESYKPENVNKNRYRDILPCEYLNS